MLEEVDNKFILWLTEQAQGDDERDHATLSTSLDIVSDRRGSINGIDIRYGVSLRLPWRSEKPSIGYEAPDSSPLPARAGA